MHELSLIHSMFDEIEVILTENSITKLTDIHLEVGEISGVDVEFLRSTYELYIPNTKWSHVNLHLKLIPWIIQCEDCKIIQKVENSNNFCLNCGSIKTMLIRGREFTIQKVEGEVD